ncbi:MAG TPA: NADH-quinone oxidoreductase subunit N [Candidatus Megaira endosymbiont of Nemacystus decipiens]|nr:NADH-quinone oxidoreductase subunit N [Candidatus Megaera endosymbiont of Nemacystus decipiens]
MISQFSIIIPEITLASIAMMVQVIAVFNEKFSRKISVFALLFLLGLVVFLICNPVEYSYYGGSFLTSSVINLFKAIVLGLTLMSIIIYRDFVKIAGGDIQIEFITIMLLATLGIFITISARDFLLLFCGLELQALSGYALTAFNTKDEKSSEAGLKYFILGALVSGIMLMGISFVYGFSGSINFLEIKYLVGMQPNVGIIFGMVFVTIAILFKLSVSPFHVWTPDVYEGAPISVVSYFSTAQKLGMLLVLINIIDGIIVDYPSISEDILRLSAILSMIVGSFGAIKQDSLKRLMAYSSILNMGYVLMAVTIHSTGGNNVAYIYMLIYAISTIGLFASFVALLGKKSDIATFEDLSGVALRRKTLAAVIAIIMFSMIGLPPFAGFFGKYYVFSSATSQGEFAMVGVGLLSSVISAFYYLKFIKYMYFVDPVCQIERIATKRGLWFVTTISASFTIFFFLFAHKYIV